MHYLMFSDLNYVKAEHARCINSKTFLPDNYAEGLLKSVLFCMETIFNSCFIVHINQSRNATKQMPIRTSILESHVIFCMFFVQKS